MASDLATKLLIKPEARVLLLNAPIGYAKKLGPLPDGATITDKREKADVVVAFARDSMELKRLATSFGTLEEDAILWVCYPKVSARAGTDLDRDVLHAAMEKHELSETSALDFDATWSAMRFSAPEDIGS